MAKVNYLLQASILEEISALVKSLTYSTGFPAHNCPAGINLPGGTTLLGPTTAPLSILAPSKTTDLNPINTSSSMVQEYRVTPFYTFTKFPMFTEAGIPVGKLPAVEITVLSPMEVLFPILTAFTSPLITTPYHTWDSFPI